MRNRRTIDRSIDPVASMLVCEAIWESKRMEINAQMKRMPHSWSVFCWVRKHFVA
jgi:hypothetical protein